VEFSDGTTESADVAAAMISTSATTGCFFGFADKNPPRQVRVRWPDGSSSRHDVPPAATVLTLTKPEN
jgi:hypothetical protein